MSKTIPDIDSATSPIGFTKLIQAINTQFTALLPWMEKPLGRALVVDGKPLIYDVGNRHYLATPNNNLSGYCFYVLNDDTFNFIEPTPDGSLIEASVDFSIVIWLNTQETSYYGNKRFDEMIDYLRRDIVNALRTVKHPYALQVTQIQEGYNNVFSGFETTDFSSKYLSVPYYGYKVNLSTKLSYCN